MIAIIFDEKQGKIYEKLSNVIVWEIKNNFANKSHSGIVKLSIRRKKNKTSWTHWKKLLLPEGTGI